MKFKLFKPHLKKSALLSSIIITVLLIIGVAVFGALTPKDNSKQAEPLERLVLCVIDGLLIMGYVWALNFSSSFAALAYVITSKTYITKETKTTITKFTNPWWIHLLTAAFLIAIYFLSITGLMYAYDDNWVQSIDKNWWIALIIFVLNFLVIEFDYNLNLYKFNHDQAIISEI